MLSSDRARGAGWLALALAAAACSTTDVGHASVSGTISGAPFTAGDAIVVVDAAQKVARIELSSRPNACADVRDNIARQNSRVLLIDVADAAGATLAAGSYMTAGSDAPPLQSTLFESHLLDGQCAVAYDPPPDGTGDGIVTLTSVSATTVEGSFDVILENGEHITGTFEPTACPDLANASSSPTCMP